MPSPIVCRVRIVGYAQIEGDSRVHTASVDPSSQTVNAVMDRLLRLPRLSSTCGPRRSDGRAVQLSEFGAGDAVRSRGPRGIAGHLHDGADRQGVLGPSERRGRAHFDLPLHFLAFVAGAIEE